MPKRSNDFQRLIYLVRLNLANGAEVTESHLMRDRQTKRFREVDVVIRGTVGTQSIIVSIECRDHKRVADVTWIDAMKSKHERLDTNVLLLASSKGFTDEAERVAKSYGIQLFTLESQNSVDIAEKLGPLGSLWHKCATVSAEAVSVRVKMGSGASETVRTNPDNLLFLQDAKELCQIHELITRLLRSEATRDYLLKEATEEHKWFEVVWEPPTDHEGRPLYMQKVDPRELREIEAIRVTGPCNVEIGKFRFQYGRLGVVNVAWSKANVAGRDAMAVATVSETGDAKLSLNFKGSVVEQGRSNPSLERP